MFDKLKKQFNKNRNVVYVTLFLISLVLSCFNLFTGLHDIALTIITFIILGLGFGIMFYDIKEK